MDHLHSFALFAGSAAAAIFMLSQLPMLIKAARTKDLGSYSFANIGLANVGNVLYAVYVYQLPVGPIWAIHAFYLAATALMLVWYLRYARRSRRDTSSGAAQELLDSEGDRPAADAAPPGSEQRRPVVLG